MLALMKALALALQLLVPTFAVTSKGCRDPFLSPFGPGSLWNVAIGSGAQFVPANIYPPQRSREVSSETGGHGPSPAHCANMTKHVAQRTTCPGAFAGITAAQCAAKGCCFSAVHCDVPCPWCFTPMHQDQVPDAAGSRNVAYLFVRRRCIP